MGRGLDGIMQIKVKNSSSYSILGIVQAMIMVLIITSICFECEFRIRKEKNLGMNWV